LFDVEPRLMTVLGPDDGGSEGQRHW